MQCIGTILKNKIRLLQPTNAVRQISTEKKVIWNILSSTNKCSSDQINFLFPSQVWRLCARSFPPSCQAVRILRAIFGQMNIREFYNLHAIFGQINIGKAISCSYLDMNWDVWWFAWVIGAEWKYRLMLTLVVVHSNAKSSCQSKLKILR